MSFSLNDEKVKNFLQDWFILGEHQFGKYRNQVYRDLDGYIEFIKKCREEKIPAFTSIQPVLKVTNLFFEFDYNIDMDNYSYDMSELDGVWIETLILVKKLKKLGAKPLIFYSGRRGYHVYAYVFNQKFKAELELRVRKFYKDMIFGIIGDGKLFPNFDKLPTHINALSRMPFSYHQKTGNQVVPLTENRKPYIPDVFNDYRCYPINESWVYALLENRVYNFGEEEEDKNKNKPEDFKNFKIRSCIQKQMLINPDHYQRLAFLMDAIYAGMPDEGIHDFFRMTCDDYNKRKTQYQINYSRRKAKQGIRPCTCEKLKEWGICDNSCKKSNIPW